VSDKARNIAKNRMPHRFEGWPSNIPGGNGFNVEGEFDFF
jgi:hypothetical protein